MISDSMRGEICLDDLVLKENVPYTPRKGKYQAKWDEFHTQYVTEVGDIVGFKWSRQKLRAARQVFEDIADAYNHNPVLQQLFGSYAAFFHCFFTLPYGIDYKAGEAFGDGKYSDRLPALKEEYAALKRVMSDPAASVDEKDVARCKMDELRELIRTIAFVRGINLPALVGGLVVDKEYKRVKHRFKKDEKAVYVTKEGKLLDITLRPSFEPDLWSNVFSGSDDCIFTTLSARKVDDEKGEEHEVIDAHFQKFWFASLLHYANPRIHYLDFRAHGAAVPSPLFRVKLMDAEDAEGRKYLILGAVLGESFDAIREDDREKVMDYIDSCVVDFFRENYSEGDFLFYNLSHVHDEKKPYNQFVEHIKRRCNVVESKLRPAEGCEPGFTHILNVPSDVKAAHSVSNRRLAKDEDGDEQDGYAYNGEQYSETFMHNRKGAKPAAFVCLEGKVKGFDIKHDGGMSEGGKMSLAKRLAIGGLVVLGAIGGYLSLQFYSGTDSPKAAVRADAGMDTKAYSSHSAPKRRYPDLAADEFFVSDKYHDDWRVSPYVTKDGLPAFGPHSHDKLTGNAQEIPPPLPDPAQAYLACKDYGEKEKVIETLSQTPEGRLYLEGRLRDEEDPRAFMTIFETLFSADQALRRGRPHLERYVYTRAAFCGRLAMESVTPDQAFCSDRGYYFEFGPCVCYDGLEADGGWENTAESDMNYSVQSRPELTSAPSPFFSACSKYDCEFKIESCTERGCTYIHCVPNPTTEDVSCTIGGEYSEQLTSPSARISSG